MKIKYVTKNKDKVTEDIKEGCTIIKNQAELLKVKFGSALASESQENEIVCIPGLRGREPKEICRDLRNALIGCGLRRAEVDELFVLVRGIGYRLTLNREQIEIVG